ncbi:MAG: hypothetical protein L0G22_06865 [Propionibacteriaceae bacterium]|nr:hypothetical protein [Propionibacteriaceae bacterium]
MDAVTRVPHPVNEPVLTYAPGSAERAALEVRLAELAAAPPVALDAWIGGERRPGSGEALTPAQRAWADAERAASRR